MGAKTKVKDFDKFFSESQKETVDFIFKKHKYKISTSPSMNTVLILQNMMGKIGNRTDLTDKEIRVICSCIMGEAQFEKLMDTEITAEEFSEIFTFIYKAYGESLASEEEKEDTGKNALKSASSKTGNS